MDEAMGTFGTVRVYEIARTLGITTDEVVEKLRARGEDVTSASSSVHASVAEVFIAQVRAQSRPTAPTVVRRQTKPIPVMAPPATTTPAPPAAPEPEPLELYDMRTRFERQLAAARARNNPRGS
jgi:cell division septation protein DedD